jgi:hypothetical protein
LYCTKILNVSVSLLGPDTNFDTLLSVYDKVRQGNTTVLNRVACNDNSQSSIQSAIFLLPLIKNHTYMIMVDGWGGGGLFDFNVTISNCKCHLSSVMDFDLTLNIRPCVEAEAS